MNQQLGGRQEKVDGGKADHLCRSKQHYFGKFYKKIRIFWDIDGLLWDIIGGSRRKLVVGSLIR